MKLRTQLLLVSLLVLVLPWAGCQYVREMETALREGQEEALLGSARAIASVLQNRPGLLSRATTQPGTPAGGGPAIYAHPLAGPLHLDGYFDDWNLGAGALEPLDDGARFAAGEDGRHLYLFFEVADDHIAYVAGDGSAIGDGDRVVLGFDTPHGTSRRLLFSTAAPGPILARAAAARIDSGQPAA
ncbi:MAG TPA: hypothetical protein VM616_03590 [Gammaproteobacteria bacterium]|nr:hypothetical protein [Gammaproteobacteria bacterium]